MSIAESIPKFKFIKNHTDIAYLKQTGVGDVIIKGLTETYLAQPQNPTKFLANWLLNEHRSYLIKEKQEKTKDIQKESLKKQEAILIQKQINTKKEEETQLTAKTEKEKIIQYIKASKDIDDIINELCSKLEKLVDATGAYVYQFDKKRKPVKPLDDEFSHLLDLDVFRIVAFSDSHKELMKGKYLEPEEGVIPEVFAVKDDDKDGNNPNADDTTNQSKLDLPLNKQIKHVLVDEVLRNPKAKFFREPRLGCLLALDFSYPSSINESSLISSMEMLREFKEEERLIQEERKTKVEELKDFAAKYEIAIDNNQVSKENQNNVSNDIAKGALEDNEKIGDENDQLSIIAASLLKQPIHDAEGNLIDVEGMINEVYSKKAVLKEFEKKEKKMVLVLDTLGKDRIFTNEEQDLVFLTCKTIIDVRVEQEKARLLGMRDLRLSDMKAEKDWLEQTNIDKIHELEEAEFKRYISEKYEGGLIPKGNDSSEEDDAFLREYEQVWSKTRFILSNQLKTDEVLNRLFLDFSKYEFVEFEKVFQNILYFVGVSNSEINFEETNKLNWKVARKFWNNSILSKLEAYIPLGAKKVHNNKLTTLNRLISVFRDIDEEKIKEYSLVLWRLLDAIKNCMTPLLLLNFFLLYYYYYSTLIYYFKY